MLHRARRQAPNGAQQQVNHAWIGGAAQSQGGFWAGQGGAHQGEASVRKKTAAGVVRIPVALDQRLTLLAHKTGRPKSYYARKALERFIEDTEDYLLAEASYRASRRTYSSAEVKKLLGLDD